MFRFFGLLAAACLLCLTTLTAPSAQNQQPQQGGRQFRMDPDRMVENLNRDLTLTADQQKKIKAIYEKAAKDAAPSAGSGATGAAARRQRMTQQNNAMNDFQKRREAINAEIKIVLTPEQQKKFDARSRFGGGGSRNMNMEDRIAQMDQRLKLSADQKKKLQAVYEKQNKAMQKRMEDMRQQGNAQQNVDRQAMMETLRKEREQNQKEIEAVLTPGQLKQYRAMQEEMTQQRQQRQQQGGGNTQQR